MTGRVALEDSGGDAAIDTSAPQRPACNASTYNTWLKSPGSSSSSYPGVSAAASLTLGGDLVTSAGVVQSEFVIAPLDGGSGIAGDAYFGYVGLEDMWQHGVACATEIYLPTSDAFPWVLVGATGFACNLTSQGIWYPTYPRGDGAPTYLQVPPYDASRAPSSFALDAAGNVYTTGGAGSTCASGSGVPYGPCIQKYDGESWASLASGPGAQQITSGSDDAVLFALDQNHGIWSVEYPGSAAWSEIAVTSICRGGTLTADLIAANSGFVYAINDAGGAAGNVYSLAVGSSTCWSAVDDSVQMMSISANPQLDGESALLGSDASGGLWYFCNGKSP
jgi:hypothetical protein